MIKLAAMDLDGTLLDSKGQVSKKNKQAILDAQANGVKIVFLTGRSLVGIDRILKEFNFVGTDNYIITSRGAHCYYMKDQSLVFASEIPSDKAMRVIEFAKKMELTAYAYTADERFLATRKDDYVVREEKTLAEHECKRLDLASEKEKGTCFTKIVVAGEEYKVESISEKIKAQKVDELKDLVALNLESEHREILAKGTDKANMLLKVIEKLGINKDEVLVIGDNEDDICLFDMYPNSAVAKNGRNFVKDHAAKVVHDNDHDAVAAAFKAYKVK